MKHDCCQSYKVREDKTRMMGEQRSMDMLYIIRPASPWKAPGCGDPVSDRKVPVSKETKRKVSITACFIMTRHSLGKYLKKSFYVNSKSSLIICLNLIQRMRKFLT